LSRTRPGYLKPIYGAEKIHDKIEDMLLLHLYNMVICLNERDKASFDESMEFTEFLLEDDEDSYNEMMNFKSEIETMLYKKVTEIVLNARKMSNTLKQKRYKKRNTDILEWDFRRSYLKKLVEIYTKKRLLDHRVQTYAKLEEVEDAKWSEEAQRRVKGNTKKNTST